MTNDANARVEPSMLEENLRIRRLARDPRLMYYLYLPSRGAAGAPVFVTVHGITRNAEDHARRFAPHAEEQGVVLIAPLFPAGLFPRYQRLGRDGRGERPDRVLDEIVAEVGAMTGAKTDKLYLFGYSGGGQFVHRYTMAYPHRVMRYVVGAAGWYTFPDPDTRFPRGIKPRDDLPGVTFDPKAFLNVPGAVVVGERDAKADKALNQSARITLQQGGDRLERGRRWVSSMRQAALDVGLHTPYLLHVLPDCGHSFQRCMVRAGMGALIFKSLFDPVSNVLGL